MNNYKLLGITLEILITSSIISAGFTNPAYAKSSKVKVDCTEVAITLISWDALYKYIDLDDLTAIEDAFGDDNEVNPASFDEIIDDHTDRLRQKRGAILHGREQIGFPDREQEF